MAHGFFTIEEWKKPRGKAKGGWTPILYLDACESQTKALQALEARGKAGLYRVLQTQRCIWAEMEGGKLHLHGCHASSPEGLAELTEIYVREGGRRPVEKARQDRLAAKKARVG
jgi:hypothetical protein